MDTWEASLESYFTGWRDGYAQALDDVDSVIDEQRDGGWERLTDPAERRLVLDHTTTIL